MPMQKTQITTILVLNHSIETYAKFRQLKRIKEKKEPRHLTEKELEKCNAYNRDKLYFSIITSTLLLCLELYIINYEVHKNFLKKFTYFTPTLNEALFFCAFSFLTELIELPLVFFKQFVIEQIHEFNTMTKLIFITDFLKNSVINFIFTFIPIYVLLYFMQTFELFYLYAFAFILPFQIFMILIYPDFIQPLFNKFKKFENEALQGEIEEMSRKFGFKLKGIMVMDGKIRSHHSNAYFTGLFKEKRVVLFDTLLEEIDDRQLLAVLCHEFGHCKLNHILKRLLLMIVLEFSYLFLFNLVVKNSAEKNILKFIFFMNLTRCVNVPMQFLDGFFSRKHENEADAFAVQQGSGKDLGTALVKMHKDNKGIVHVDPFYAKLYFSHPSLFERLDFIECEMKKIGESVRNIDSEEHSDESSNELKNESDESENESDESSKVNDLSNVNVNDLSKVNEDDEVSNDNESSNDEESNDEKDSSDEKL